MSEPNYVYVCMNTDCKNRGAARVLHELTEKASGATQGDIEIKPYLCFSACNIGPNVVIPAKQCWLSGVKPSDADSIIEYLNGGPELTDLVEENEPELKAMIFAIIDAGLIPE
jgi:NADH:ubiquinone oxidoreductase subunit E